MQHTEQTIDVFLQPGDCVVGDERHTLRTLLGSCVSITLWHPLRRIGVMSHFLLPGRHAPMPEAPEGRYGDEAMLLMQNALARLDIPLTECQAKIFGGAEMFVGQRQADSLCVGTRNGEAARALLQAQHVEIVSEDLFGFGHRQIIFKVRTGDVWVRQEQPAGLASREQR